KKPPSIYPPSDIKERYRIDVLAPLYLSELVQDGKVVDKTKLPDKVIPSLKFYEGMVLATDTLKKLGYKFDLYIYDVADELESPATLVNTDAFMGSDLILGILSSKDFPLIANYAKKHHINFVSALSPSNHSVSDNPYFMMIQPTLETHCDAVEQFIYKKNGIITPLLFYRTTVSVDNVALSNFVTNNAIEFKKVPCDEMPTRDQLLPLLSKDIKNVIVMPILNDKYVDGILLRLNQWFPDYQFEVWGMPSWDNMISLKKADAYPNIVIYFTSPFYFDPSTASGQAVMNAYKRKYVGKADNMVFRGYETMLWYANLLKRYGTIFNEHLWDTGGAPFTRYEIKPETNEKGDIMYYENKHVYLYRYQGSSYMVEQ
ncbi:MAG: hypothetical protein KDC07_04390, partial [Chitinophagaceae bacterium]|nr:hypothetical protein [Chitinophagaceae bacterium]